MSDYPIVNNEITSKLRSEIRKKLDEIGRSSDDELPEYIMVMIANQRTKFQMKDDLSLFLGRDCISFVDWLLDRMEILKSEQENKSKSKTTSSNTASTATQQSSSSTSSSSNIINQQPTSSNSHDDSELNSSKSTIKISVKRKAETESSVSNKKRLSDNKVQEQEAESKTNIPSKHPPIRAPSPTVNENAQNERRLSPNDLIHKVNLHREAKQAGAVVRDSTNKLVKSPKSSEEVSSNKRSAANKDQSARSSRKYVGHEQKDKNDIGIELILDEEMDLDLVGGEDKLNTPSQSDEDEDEDGGLEQDGNEDDNADGEDGKMQERCKYWPSCTTGDDCPYHHPTTPCRAFPNCRFGDKCLYIHPTCKFDPGCNRRGCPFAHSGGARRMAPKAPYWTAPAPVAIAKCKFGTSCLNPKCSFIHPRPEPCRFGSHCLLDTCPFTHPNDELNKKPSQSAFKWTAQS